ncbi:hypothetical protein AB5I41_13535 [Sphingomonas sp. MMS24-JH45]
MAAELQVIDTGMATATTDRQKALDAALAQIDRAFGKGSAMRLGRGDDAGRGRRPAGWGSTSRSAWAACRAVA